MADRVLHLYAGNLYGGIERLLATLASGRHAVPDMEPEFALTFRGQLWDELRAADVAVHDLGPVRFSRPWTLWRARRRLRALLRARRYAVAVTHACWPHAAFAPVVRRAGVRLVNWVHDVLSGQNWVERWAGRTPPDLVVANGRYSAGRAGVVFPASPRVVHHAAVEAQAVPDRAARRSAIRSKLGTSTDTVVVLQASRLERCKGHAVHIDALGRLRSLPGWELWMTGDPQKAGEAAYLNELRRQADRCGIAERVKFVGHWRQLAELLAAADIFCQPNVEPESFGLVFIEALYAGLPVVAAAAGGPMEILDATCGVLVPPGDAAALARALGGLIGDPARRQQLAAAGPALARELCDPDRQLRRLAGLLLGSCP